MLYDKARVRVQAGAGGDGCVSFRREAHVPRGGPDGGDGGHGGDVILRCDPSLRDLGGVRSRQFQAGRGRHGQGSNKQGARGENVVIAVPPGTQGCSLRGERVDLVRPGQEVVLARGGRGGHGNRRFTTAVRQAPRFAERGTSGEAGWIELALKLLADVGLVGLPNAGKSSLLSRLTRARPKVADYPFTTLEPVLGTIEAADRQLVVADIPGLIEGAAGGAGLGQDFLAHIERCAVLVHVVELAPAEGEPLANYRTIREELEAYGGGLDLLPEVVALSKADLWSKEDVADQLREWQAVLGDSVGGVVAVSSVDGTGIRELTGLMLEAVPETVTAPNQPELAGEQPVFEAEYLEYRPSGETGYSVEAEGESVWRVRGRGVETLFERFDLTNEEALAHLAGRLREMGVMAALERAGFMPGDEVRVGEYEFELL
jgi:GTPase